MKAGKEHRVPLCLAPLPSYKKCTRFAMLLDGFVFPGGKTAKPLSNMAFLMLLRRMDRGDLTAHGFRINVPRLDGRAHEFPVLGSRNGACAHGRRQGGGRVSPR